MIRHRVEILKYFLEMHTQERINWMNTYNE